MSSQQLCNSATKLFNVVSNTIVRGFYCLVLIYGVMLVFITPIRAAEVINGGFESDKESWNTTTSTVTFSVVENPAYEASHSASINYASSTSNGIKQSVSSIKPDQMYRISAMMRILDTTKKAFLRVAWYQSGVASQLKTDDSPLVTSSASWSTVEIIAVAPINASSAEIRVLVSEGTVFVDSIQIEEYILPSPTVTPTFTVTPTATPTLQNSTIVPLPSPHLENIYVSEVMTYPSSGEQEWVEIYNANEVEIILEDWQIDDIGDGGSAARQFSLTIPAKGYGILDFSSAIFNNSGDTVRLLDADGAERDSFAYSNSAQGYTWARKTVDAVEYCLELPTKNYANGLCMAPTISPTPTITKVPTPTSTPVMQKYISSSNASRPAVAGSTVTSIKHFENMPSLRPTPSVKINDTFVHSQKPLQEKQTNSNPIHNLSLTYSLLSLASISWKIYSTATMNQNELS